MRALTRAVAVAAGSGRFVSTWSIAITLPLSLTVMAPVGTGAVLPHALPGLLATWACFATGLWIVALLERHTLSTRVRVIVVLVGVVLCGTLRPLVQDAWLRLGGIDTPPSEQLPFRIATNIVVWMLVLSVVAVFEGSLRALRRTNALLQSVATALSQAQARSETFAREARDLVGEASSALVTAIDATPDTSEGARRLGGEHIRAWSHRLAALADTDGAEHEDQRSAAADSAGRRTAALPRLPLRLPPRGIVTVAYAASLLPYAAHTQEPTAVLTGLALLVVGGAVADAGARWRAGTRGAHHATGLFLALSAVIGVALSLLAITQGVAPFVAAVSAVAYLGFALAATACTGALHDLRRDRRRLSGSVADAHRATRAGTRPTRDGLRGTAELLHRDGQGACIMFALAHPEPTLTALLSLRNELRSVVDRMPQAFSAAQDPGAQVSLSDLFDTWAHVIDLRIDIDDESASTLRAAPWIARECYDVLAEGLLNCAKHGSERRAEVSLRRVASGAGPRLRVRVRTAGPAVSGAALRPTSRMHELGAHLISGPAGVTLEASFALADPAVVSAEHRH